MLTIYEVAALLLSLSAFFGWANQRYLKLPHTISLMMMGLGSSLALLAVQKLAPGLGLVEALQAAIRAIDFYDAIMNGMLAFLLFAGALHVDLSRMRDQKWAIALMATGGVVISTLVIGFGVWAGARVLSMDLPLIWAMVFGALISPTDPVAVLGLLKTVKVPDSVKAKIAGESLFNDGVAVVAFSVLVAAAAATTGAEAAEQLSALHIAELILYEGFGGALFGLVMGWLAHRAMRSIDNHVVEVLISLALCSITYALCLRLHISGPIAVVVAGLLLANHNADITMSDTVQKYLFGFWEVTDEVLNSVLFLLIGLEVLVLTFVPEHAWVVLLAIPVVLLGRLIAVAAPVMLLRFRRTFDTGVIPVMTWGGLRGGVSVALALSLPDSPYKPMLLAVTYAVVIFSIVVQGLTIKQVVARTMPVEPDPHPERPAV